MPTNFYGELIPPSGPLGTNQSVSNEVSQPSRITIEVDMNEANLTLFQVIHRTRKVIDEVPEDAPITIYFVSGFKQHNTYDFWNDYFRYLQSIPNLDRMLVVYRGYIHLQLTGFFFIGCPVYLSADCKVILDSANLFDIMRFLANDAETFNKFTSRFFGFYKSFNYIVMEDLTELSILGFKFQTF